MYSELGAASHYSFLRSVADPEELARRAAELNYKSIALSDYGGVYGIPKFHRAAKAVGVRAIVGASLDILDVGRVRLLCQSQLGYQNLCRLLTQGHANQKKGHCQITLETLSELNRGLTCIAGPQLNTISAIPLAKLRNIFGEEYLNVECHRHLTRYCSHLERRLQNIAETLRLKPIATNNVMQVYAHQKSLLDTVHCIRTRHRLSEAGRLLTPNAECRLKSPVEMKAIFHDAQELLRNTEEVAERCAFDFENLGYQFPRYPLPQEVSEQSHLHELTMSKALNRYGNLDTKVIQQLEHELRIIGKLGLAGYFLIVYDICEYAKSQGILVQGRGSAANSALCYSLGITAVDPIGMQLLFERFLSEERGEWPDIDLDLPSGPSRERVIQYVYERYGPHGAAMTANTITFRQKSALRETGRVLGFDDDALSKASNIAGRWSDIETAQDLADRFQEAGLPPSDPKVAQWMRLSKELLHSPRHLGQHSGGMVIAANRLDTVVPIEPASMAGRSVIQWDKEDSSNTGIIKIDLLGLGMLAAFEDALPQIKRAEGIELDLSKLPMNDSAVFDLLQRADTVGVFQVESRAQMSMLPRLKPRCFYDLVVEIALVRPGPIVGEMVHPYLRRRDGLEKVSYPHPSLEPALARTLGVPIFQEQIIRVAMSVANFSGGEAEELRRAMGFKRSEEKMRHIQQKLRQGMTQNGIPKNVQNQIVQHISSFALYGFPESHSASFALIAYASAYLKVHHPAGFLAGLLNAWPMGFYHPSTLLKDAQRRGVRVLPIDVQSSQWETTLLSKDCIRLGLRFVKGVRASAIGHMLELRQSHPFQNLRDFKNRTLFQSDELERLAEAGALAAFGKSRRQALWQLGTLKHKEPLFTELPYKADPHINEMTPQERVASDYKTAEVSVGPHPLHYLRNTLSRLKIASSNELSRSPNGHEVSTAGLVVVRQRPGTAKGIFFITLEDEFGFINLIIANELFEHHRQTLICTPALVARGYVQSHRGVVHLKVEKVEPLSSYLQRESHNSKIDCVPLEELAEIGSNERHSFG